MVIRALMGMALVGMSCLVGCQLFIETDEPDYKREKGTECSRNEQCLSGFCVDAVCCESACDEACKACSINAKGEGENGLCEPVLPGREPGC